MESYKTVHHRSKFEYEDRKSVFIGECCPVSTEEEALQFINEAKKRYPDAKHHVYSYILRENSIMRFSDDGEPQGTAGMPILDIIRKKELTDIAIVVTRYFGGTLLGTGGLVRAYSASAIGAIDEAKIITYDLYCALAFSISYSDYQKILPLLEAFDSRIDDTSFLENVEINCRIAKSQFSEFEKNMTELTSGRVKVQILGEKFDF